MLYSPTTSHPGYKCLQPKFNYRYISPLAGVRHREDQSNDSQNFFVTIKKFFREIISNGELHSILVEILGANRAAVDCSRWVKKLSSSLEQLR